MLEDTEKLLETSAPFPSPLPQGGLSIESEFHAVMKDDLHTAMAVAGLSEPLKAMNDLLHTKKVGGGG